MIAIVMIFLWSFITLEVDFWPFFRQFLVGYGLDFGATTQMDCISISCFADNLDDVLSDIIYTTTENFKLFRRGFNATETILNDIPIVSISCRVRNTVNFSPGRWEDGILSDVDSSWESSSDVLVGSLTEDVLHVGDKGWAGGSIFIIIFILNCSVLVAAIVMLVDESFELVLIFFVFSKQPY